MARRVPFQGLEDTGRVTGSTMADELDEVLLVWQVSEVHTALTLSKMTETAHRFAGRLSAQGVRSFTQVTPGQAAAFVLAPLADGRPPEIPTRHFRRTAVRTLYRTLRQLRYDVGDPTLDLTLPPRGQQVARPLTPEEVTLCRACAQTLPGRRGWTRASAWALGESGAISSEITQVRISDLDDPEDPTRVRLPGTRRVNPREVPLTGWARQVLTYRVALLKRAGTGEPETLLAYGGAAAPGGAKAQSSVCNALREVMFAAGLGAEVDVRPSSLRHWVGRSAYDAGMPLEQVAVLLGHRSLNPTAADIALDWTAKEAQH